MRNKSFLIVAGLSLTLLASSSFAVPKAHAQLESFLGNIANEFIGGGGTQNVRIIGDASESSLTTAIKTTLSALTGAETAGALEQLLFKEDVLDPAAWSMAKQMQQQLTGEMLKWLGGQQLGQNGQVPFVQDYGQYYQDIIDEEVGEYLFVDKAGDLSGQCDPERSHDIRTAVYRGYLEARQKSQTGGALQCGNEDNDSYATELDRLLGSFTNCTDDACAYYEANRELAVRVENRLENERQILDNSGGFIPQRVCTNVEGADGVTRQNCPIVNPLNLASEMASFNLVELPGLQMLNMDEFNEVASNLMNNLANQALQGLTGVLGLSGNPEFSVSVFGAEGNLSYVDALVQDNVTAYQSGGANPIKESIEIETEYLSLQQFMLDEIGDLEEKIENNEQEFPNCFDMELTTELNNAKNAATSNKAAASTTLAILNVLDQQFAANADASTRNSILMTYNDYKNQNFFHTNYQLQELQISYIDLEFAQMVDQFKYDTALERQSCGGDFDYEGVLTS